MQLGFVSASERSKLEDFGILAYPLEYHSPKLTDLGDVNWGRFFSALGEIGYNEAVSVEAEERAFETDLMSRKSALIQSHRYFSPLIGHIVHSSVQAAQS